MTYRKLKPTITRPGVEVVVGYSPEYKEYRYRLIIEGKPNVDADGFTEDKEDAFASARKMAVHAYKNLVQTKAASIPLDELAELRRIVTQVWQQIGHDVLQCAQECGGEELDNESAIESCLDADRPQQMCGESAHQFCKLAYQKYGFDAVCLAVSKTLNLV